MTAVEIREPGAPQVLRAVERPVPQPLAGEVLIRVVAAGVNRPDVLQRKGLYPPPEGASDIPGLELAGEVVLLGPGVREPQEGARVCALVAGGGYAQYVAAPAVQCLPVPAQLSFEEAAALPETFFTVWLNVFERSRLQRGETLLVHGGASGIGTTAILLGKAFDARVIVTAGSAQKCAACRELGADLAINYREGDFVAATLRATDGRGADVILDMVGGDYLPRNVAAAALEGRIALIGTQGGARAELDLRSLMTKRLTLTASTLRSQPVENKGRIARALRENVWPLFASRGLKPVIHARFPLADAALAHELMESDLHIGKIVLVV
ncbi:MAG: NAD(P)H-quinone oxidoreductase [Gammaproteobacteria bacterium]|nr:MAG: NAD(P)H-quinone oxidoreductase [Gammaproteobacteria bacterium]TLY85539.1 MAG: NAD(P)H-quinone oxidoreductase [Gammaproteobacteria bacterium]